MYIELFNDEYDYIKEAQKITMSEYEMKGNLIHADELMKVIEDLICQVHCLEEEVQDTEEHWKDEMAKYEEYVQDNYKPIEYKDMYEVYDRDFLIKE